MGYPDGQTKKLVQSLNKRRFQTAVPYALNGKCGNRGRFDMWGEGGSRRGWARYWVNLGSIGAIGAVFWDTNAPPTRHTEPSLLQYRRVAEQDLSRVGRYIV